MATGPDFVVGMRISGDEKDPKGLTEETSLDVIINVASDLDHASVIAGTLASQGQMPECSLLDKLEDADLPRIAIGDCVTPRTAEEAVHEGLKAAWAL